MLYEVSFVKPESQLYLALLLYIGRASLEKFGCSAAALSLGHSRNEQDTHNFTAPAKMLATRDVTLVFEPTNAHSSVPMIIQKAAGFSHVKLIIKEPGNGTNWQYDIWKDGKDSIGFGDEKGNAMRWHGLRPGETEQFVDKTTMTDDQIKKAGK